jgi:hypothetical protein
MEVGDYLGYEKNKLAHDLGQVKNPQKRLWFVCKILAVVGKVIATSDYTRIDSPEKSCLDRFYGWYTRESFFDASINSHGMVHKLIKRKDLPI